MYSCHGNCCQGDVQMSVTIILVFGASVIKLLPQTLLVQWFMSYIGSY